MLQSAFQARSPASTCTHPANRCVQAGGSTPPPAAAGGGGGSEPWRGTRMADAVRTFERCLLDGLTATNREELAGKARVAVAVGQLNMDF